MNSKISFILIGVVGIFIGILIAPIFSGNLMMGFTPGKKLAPTTSLGNIDRHFIEEMIPHHNGAIAMAELALERSGREEIRSLSEDIIKAQTLENNQMKEWYQAWFGGEVPESFSGMSGMMHGQMPMHMEGMEGDIEARACRPPDNRGRRWRRRSPARTVRGSRPATTTAVDRGRRCWCSRRACR